MDNLHDLLEISESFDTRFRGAGSNYILVGQIVIYFLFLSSFLFQQNSGGK